jgi:hypothetical protein
MVKQPLVTARVLLATTSEPQRVWRALPMLGPLLEPLVLKLAIAWLTIMELLIPHPPIPLELSPMRPVHALHAPVLLGRMPVGVFLLKHQQLPLSLLIALAQ